MTILLRGERAEREKSGASKLPIESDLFSNERKGRPEEERRAAGGKQLCPQGVQMHLRRLSPEAEERLASGASRDSEFRKDFLSFVKLTDR